MASAPLLESRVTPAVAFAVLASIESARAESAAVESTAPFSVEIVAAPAAGAGVAAEAGGFAFGLGCAARGAVPKSGSRLSISMAEPAVIRMTAAMPPRTAQRFHSTGFLRG